MKGRTRLDDDVDSNDTFSGRELRSSVRTWKSGDGFTESGETIIDSGDLESQRGIALQIWHDTSVEVSEAANNAEAGEEQRQTYNDLADDLLNGRPYNTKTTVTAGTS
jgi:hypothetical protein